MRQIIQTRRTRGAGSDWSTTLGAAARSLSVRPTASPLSNLSDPAAYLGIFGQTLGSAAFPPQIQALRGVVAGYLHQMQGMGLDLWTKHG